MTDFSWLSRMEVLTGKDQIELLAQKKVMIVGMGGVGSFAVEAIARAGIGHLILADGDTVEASNRNRQLPALVSTEGKPKVHLMAERVKDINPQANVTTLYDFLTVKRMRELPVDYPVDFVIDCIDSLMPKLTLLAAAHAHQIPVVGSMGAGGKLDPTKVHIADISQTWQCPLAFYVRKKLRKFGIKEGIPVVFSTEIPDKSSLIMTDGSNHKRSAYGTISYMPAIFGLQAASVAIRHLIGKQIPLKERPIHLKK